ncbi:hypothetical protein AYO38_05845 [bacterium SCGC AG-212-C10]|nr:hypothetical protein AYO38_05845 [bacterium SCGC AG-212-C10]
MERANLRPAVRTAYLLLIGVLSGVIGTVMVQTLRPAPKDAIPEPGGGNSRMSLDEDALAVIAQQGLPANIAIHGAKLTASVKSEGQVELYVTYTTGDPSLPTKIVFDPDVVDGRLRLTPVGDTASEVSLGLLEEALRARIRAVAGVADYKLAAITTTDRRLGFEILVVQR